ncbi:hypothetical protein DV515_00009075 [Chloebia gouldiae]|uniref:Uncharacterized protein n=1 Tax=Chloebia gouldiae TaxID=44316 RepID=A0A3L8SEI2_CHLGU|nr:hypothetical protein DV515_00009075 [Chloebia gouldiae]
MEGRRRGIETRHLDIINIYVISTTKVTTGMNSSPSLRQVKILSGAARDRATDKAAAQVQGASWTPSYLPAEDWSPLGTTSQETRMAEDRYTYNRAQAKSGYLDLSLNGARMG